MSDWGAAVARVRGEFEEALLRLDFRMLESNDRLIGQVRTTLDGQTVDHLVEIQLTIAFPYHPPKVFDSAGTGSRSWHQESDGSLCLYAHDDIDMPWRDAESLVARIAEWFSRDRNGWSGEPADLDLQRYFPSAAGLVLYDNLSALVGSPIRMSRHNEGVLRVVGTGSPRRASRNIGAGKFGWALDVGELLRPFRMWDELADLLGPRASRLGQELRSGRGDVLLVRYTQQGREGVVALRVAFRDGMFALRAMLSASQDVAVLRLRSGPDAEVLHDKRVAIVGLGAVGSFSADLLARGGVGKLTLIDGDILRPGNCVRHLAGPEYVGLSKAKAVASIVRGRYNEWVEVRSLDSFVSTLEEAESVLTEADLVMDMTGHFRTSKMLSDAAAVLGRPLVSGYLQRDGDVVRVDRWPAAADETRLDPVPSLGITSVPNTDLREAGCGDPVSPTPPSAAVSAATLACSSAFDYLTGRCEYPASVIRILRPQEDVPYDIVSRLG